MTMRPSSVKPLGSAPSFPPVGARPADPKRGPEDKPVRLLWPTTVFLVGAFAAFFMVGHAKNNVPSYDPPANLMRAR